jgi:MFS family permease
MQQVALGWLALTLTDSPAFVGLVGFTAGIPFLLIAIPAGAIIDRVDRRKVLLTCQALAAMLALIVAADVLSGFVQPWHLLVAALLNGSLQAMMLPTQQSLVPMLVAREDLTNAVGINSAGQNMTRVVGPSITGVVIGAFGTGPAFLLQAIAILAAFVLVRTVQLPARDMRPAASTQGVFEGIRLITSRPDLRTLFLLACIPTLFVFPYVQFLSIFARDILKIGPSGLGLLMASSGLGAVTGSLLVASRGQMTGAGRTLLAVIFGYGIVVVAIALSPYVLLTVPLLFLAGMMGAGYMSASNALVQLRVDDHVRGRVMSAYFLSFGLMPIGAMPMGFVADHLGTPAAVALGAMLSSILVAVAGLRSRALRDI